MEQRLNSEKGLFSFGTGGLPGFISHSLAPSSRQPWKLCEGGTPDSGHALRMLTFWDPKVGESPPHHLHKWHTQALKSLDNYGMWDHTQPERSPKKAGPERKTGWLGGRQ